MLIRRLLSKFIEENPWTNVYGLARSVLAFASLLTLAFNNIDFLFLSGPNVAKCPNCTGISKISLYCIFSENLMIAKYISMIVLIFVIIGYLPRITGLFHYYISFSLTSTASLIDGGDQVVTVLTLLMLPICLTDDRKWHWASSTKKDNSHSRIVGNIAYTFLRLQVAVIYLNAAISKFSVTEWLNGTAIYYWFNNPIMGPNEYIYDLMALTSDTSILCFLITWSVLLLELMLFCSLFFDKKGRKLIFILGIFFHILIVVIHGLVSFGLIMCGALILLLRKPNETFKFNYLERFAGRTQNAFQ